MAWTEQKLQLQRQQLKKTLHKTRIISLLLFEHAFLKISDHFSLNIQNTDIYCNAEHIEHDSGCGLFNGDLCECHEWYMRLLLHQHTDHPDSHTCPIAHTYTRYFYSILGTFTQYWVLLHNTRYFYTILGTFTLQYEESSEIKFSLAQDLRTNFWKINTKTDNNLVKNISGKNKKHLVIGVYTYCRLNFVDCFSIQYNN